MTGLLWHSLLAIFAGVLLNAAPCVLPVIPFKVQAVLHDIGNGWPRRLAAAAAMLAGSLVFFTILGGATAFLGLTWGAMFQSRIFITLLSLFLLGAGLVTLLGWSTPLPQWIFGLQGRRYTGAALTGLLTGILATPCGGPFLGAVLAYALTQPPLVSLVVFLSIGTGLVLPYMVLLTWPWLGRRSFNTGAWAVQIRQLMGFVLIGGALFYARGLLGQTISGVLWALLPISMVIWALLTLRGSRMWSQRTIPVLVTAALIAMAALSLGSVPAPELNWQPYSAAVMTRARANLQPTMLEFTAEWCLNCKVLEKTTYKDQRVIDAARKADIVAMRIDMTRMGAAEERLMRKYGGRALPYVLIIDGQGHVQRTFTGLFGAKTLVNVLARLNAPAVGS